MINKRKTSNIELENITLRKNACSNTLLGCYCYGNEESHNNWLIIKERKKLCNMVKEMIEIISFHGKNNCSKYINDMDSVCSLLYFLDLHLTCSTELAVDLDFYKDKLEILNIIMQELKYNIW